MGWPCPPSPICIFIPELPELETWTPLLPWQGSRKTPARRGEHKAWISGHRSVADCLWIMDPEVWASLRYISLLNLVKKSSVEFMLHSFIGKHFRGGGRPPSAKGGSAPVGKGDSKSSHPREVSGPYAAIRGRNIGLSVFNVLLHLYNL